MMDSTSLRDLIGKDLAKINDDRIVVIDGDIAKSTKTTDFKAVHPERFVECGISETSAMSIGYGLALEGMIPFVVNFAILTLGNAWTQVRMACYANANLKIIGTHPGIDNGQDGASHHGCEDLALARVLPNMKVLDPSTPEQLEEAINYAASVKGPVYIRVPRDKTYCYGSKPLEAGKEDIVYDTGDDFAILFEGSCSRASFDAFNALEQKGIHGKLINCVSIKPFDNELVRKIADEVKVIVTVENHTVIGGLYGCVSEAVASESRKAKVIAIGINDRFSMSGTCDELKREFGITADNIAGIVQKNI